MHSTPYVHSCVCCPSSAQLCEYTTERKKSTTHVTCWTDTLHHVSYGRTYNKTNTTMPLLLARLANQPEYAWHDDCGMMMMVGFFVLSGHVCTLAHASVLKNECAISSSLLNSERNAHRFTYNYVIIGKKNGTTPRGEKLLNGWCSIMVWGEQNTSVFVDECRDDSHVMMINVLCLG